MFEKTSLSPGLGGRPAIYYGWWILAAGAVTEMLALGSTSYAAGLFVLPLEQEFGLSRAAANSSIPISFAGAAIMGPAVGYLLDRFSISWVLIAGAVTLGIGFGIIAGTSSLFLMALALFFPVAFGGMAIGQLTTTTLVSRWFYKRRGRAFGIAAVATSGGGIVVVPLLGAGIEAYGWRLALSLEALAIALIVTVLSVFVIRSGPADLGLNAHPENEGRPATDIPSASGGARKGDAPRLWRYGTILRALNFWTIAFVLAAMVGISMALVITAVPYGAELGIAPAPAAYLITGFAITAAIVKVTSGWLAEFVNRRNIMLAAALAMLGALSILLSFSSYAALVIAYCLAGFAQGCVLPTSPALIADHFGAPSFGRVLGAMYVAIMLSSIITVWLVGLIFDRTGGYELAFRALLAVCFLAAIAAILIRVQPSVTTRNSIV
jgi:MFS family permease